MYNVTVSWVSDGYPVHMDFGPFEGTHEEAMDEISEHFGENYGEGYLDKFEVEWDFKEIKLKEYYFLVGNNGDGTSSIRWFLSKENAEVAIREEEEFFDNEDVGVVMAENLQPSRWYDE